MCGIAGFYGFRDDNLIKRFSKELRHRGPDGEGFYIDNKVSLLNRRLAIIDLKTGDQPIFNEDESVVVVYNGEIYNFQELRKTLLREKHIFKTNSDTEVIAHSYEKWGEACFDKFNGMFAIALYDKKKDKLVLTRDHFGIKPLYYAFSKNKNLIFSSEIRPILESGLIEKKPNDRIIYRYLKYRVHDDQKETFFEGIYKLMPGETMIVRNSGVEIQSFSSLEKERANEKEERLTDREIEKFKKELERAIKYRLISDVPVGTCLSGGLDSSTIAAYVNKFLEEKREEVRAVGKRQNTFSAVFPGGSNNEEIYIDKLIQELRNIDSHKIYPKPEEFFDEIKDFVKTQEEPTISTGPYAQYKVMQEAKKYVKVLLDGQGADEMMAGYLPYYFVYLRQLLLDKNYLRLFKEAFFSKDVLIKYLVDKFKRTTGIIRSIDPTEALNKKFSNRYKKEKFKVITTNLKKRLIQDIFYNSLPSLLRYEDKNSMRFSIEGRVPFLDVNLLKYTFRLSDEVILKNGWNKNILRESVAGLLPELIKKRRDKIGFTTPEYEWFLRMKNKIYSVFQSESFGKRKYFNQERVLARFEEFIAGKNDDTLLFWRLLNLELWLQVFFDKTEESRSVFELGKPNPGKKLNIKARDKIYTRVPIRTDIFKKGDRYEEKIADYIIESIKSLDINKEWFVVISEKIVAIAQGRSYFTWEIKTGIWAQILSKFVRKTPYGIGLGSPWTMQLAIHEVGLPKILLATIISAITKPLGKKGLFYKIAGREVAAIDGPTEYSVYPSNFSAKLGPKEPQKASEKIKEEIIKKTRDKNFQGVAIIDANDLGQDILGNSTNLSDNLIGKIFKDNPMGQAREQTPICIVQRT